MITVTEEDTGNWIEEIGKPSFDAIAEMVAALQCDYDRLEELIQSGAHERRIEHGDLEPSDEDKEILEELDELREAAGWTREVEHGDGCENEDEARQRIDEDPLSLRIFGERTDGEWVASDYELLLTTGGPAVRIIGDLDNGEATSARLQVQDWFKPWSEYIAADTDVLMAYVGCFYFGG